MDVEYWPLAVYYLGFPSTNNDRAHLQDWALSTADLAAFTCSTGFLELITYTGLKSRWKKAESHLEPQHPSPPELWILGVHRARCAEHSGQTEAARAPVVKDLDFNGRASVPLTEWEKERGFGAEEMVESYKETIKHVAMVLIR
ncbi:hypothetical protein GCG54_00001104 [Colletotrichum gloeosporioides]|uniref:Uncharacterized protein n=1 Tax=Colletotrichum gloeosporioides TaxID=474922 RepID=A0A8H4C9N4_COLGL|nr:uncharacterized protein GCG54_00001104 [Colletotrichum gloeosporioides]KAF3799995.1 hypothetical protein GCG54_00001104 [Colletotrichum gloeosporioides]